MRESTPQILKIDDIFSADDFSKILNRTFLSYIQHHQDMLSYCKDLEDFFAPLLLIIIYNYTFDLSVYTFLAVTVGEVKLFYYFKL